MKFIYAEGATQLNADEIHNLIPKHLMSENDLNDWYKITNFKEKYETDSCSD